MELLVAPIMGCIAQACCWYSIFNWCGCIQDEREVVRTEQPIVVLHSNNPFKNPNVQRDSHLRPAYG